MTANESWDESISWFEQYAADPAYCWASFFPNLLRSLRERKSTVGLYAHRWATMIVVSRFGAHPDWQIGPKVELLVLPNGCLEVSAFDAYSKLKERITIHDPVDLRSLDDAMRFAAGEVACIGAS